MSIDDVTSSVQRFRAATERGGARLAQLGARVNASGGRQALRSPLGHVGSPRELVDELALRDEDLQTAMAELREQLAALSRACGLLERERAKYVDLFQHAPEALVVTDLGGVTTEANLAAGDLFSVDAGFLLGRALITFVARKDTRGFRFLLRELGAAREDAEARSFTLRMRPRGQAVFVAAGRVAVIRTAQRRPVGLRWTLRRLDGARAEECRTLSEGDFASMLVADLQGPVNAVVAWSTLLRAGALQSEDDRSQAVGCIARGAEAQARYLGDLLELRALVEAPDKTASERVHLEGLACEVASATTAPLLSGGRPPIAVQASAPTDAAAPALVWGVRKELARCLELLLQRTAAGLDHDGEPALVSARVRGDRAILEVAAPEGAGVARGWGVRMAIAARLVERHGGRLVLSERSPGCLVIFAHAAQARAAADNDETRVSAGLRARAVGAP